MRTDPCDQLALQHQDRGLRRTRDEAVGFEIPERNA
jgi:hypothetical protein